MYLDACTLASSSHGGIQLGQLEVDTCHKRKLLLNSFHYATSHVFEQLRRLRHLTFHQSVQLCIINGIAYIITLHGGCHVITHSQRHVEVGSHSLFLLQHPMIGM